MSLEIVSNGLVDNIPAFVQIMAWRRTGEKPLCEPKMILFTNAYMPYSVLVR